jgi:hypothetical protein
MNGSRKESTERPLLTATAAGKGLGDLPIGSAQSRAAARALLTARQGIEAEGEWDKPFDAPIDLAERLDGTMKHHEQGEVSNAEWTPIHIPPGKEDTVRGRLAARINAAMARVASHEAKWDSAGR